MGQQSTAVTTNNITVPAVAISADGTKLLQGQSIYGTGNLRVFLVSGTFTVPGGVTKIRVRVNGAGGSGASTRTGFDRATGGAGGGFAMGDFSVTPGTSYSVTVGAGGASVQEAAGNAGGTSSFGALISATGGQGGMRANGVFQAGATGGTGTGGDVQYSGGASGSVNFTLTASGGGSAATILGPGYKSGDVSTVNYAASAGASCLAASANATAATGYGGAGCGGTSSTISGGPSVVGNVASAGAAGAGYPTYSTQRFLGDGVFGGGGGGSITGGVGAGAGGPGAGGGSSSTGTVGGAGAGGIFGGGGACAVSSAGGTPAGAGGIGAGGGGGVNNGSTAPISGPGGPGLVIVEW